MSALRQRWPLALWSLGLPLGLALLFAFAHASGWREHTSLLSGTHPGSSGALTQGLVYVAAWFALVLVAPIAALSGALALLLERLPASVEDERQSP